MKRNQSNNHRPLLQVLGTAVVAAALVAGPGLAGVAFAVDSSPTPAPSSTLAPTTSPSPSPAVPTAGAAPAAPGPAPSVPPASTTGPPSAVPSVSVPSVTNESMAQAIGVGGAEMGQRSRRVTASSPSASIQKLQTESLSTEGTWMPTFGVQGLDVSGHQPNVDWQQQWNMGARFAYVKASEGNYFTNDKFNSQYQGSRNVGMIRGAYHFAIPNWSSGADQARYFVANGGGWSADGYTMPPVLDFEFNPYENRTINGFYFGNTCYGMSAAQLGSWVRDFGNTMQSLTGRLPVIYTNTNWWNQCLGNPSGFGDYPLWVAAYPGSPTNNAGSVPTGSWSNYSIWQYSSTGPLAGDSNVWNGDYAGLQKFATIGDSSPLVIGPSGGVIYFVVDGRKHPFPNWDTYEALARIGGLSKVNQSYLDQLALGAPVGRFVRGDDGAIFLVDQGRKHHVPSCSLMNDYGGGFCDRWVPLTDGQLDLFVKSDPLARATSSPSGRLFYVEGGSKREFFDASSLSEVGLSYQTVPLSDAVTAGMPYGAPIIRQDVIVVDRRTGAPYINTAGKFIPVSTSINANNLWARKLQVAAMDEQSIDKVPKSTTFGGLARNSAGTQSFMVGKDQKYPTAAIGQWPGVPVVFSNALLGIIPTGQSIGILAFVKSDSSATVFRFENKMLREVPDLETLYQFGLGQMPTLYSLAPETIDSIAKDAPILRPGRLYVGDTRPEVYLVDGASKIWRVEDFRITEGMGIRGYTRIKQSALSPYPDSGTLLPTVKCSGKTLIGYNGALWNVAANADTAQLPARTLDPATCISTQVKGTITTSIFVKALDDPTIYLLRNGLKQPVSSWSRLVELNNGGSPVIIEYSRSALGSIPAGNFA
jgi:GH25 family lysozyme M1 (1,4-beta-N-acetylmuramidase)